MKPQGSKRGRLGEEKERGRGGKGAAMVGGASSSRCLILLSKSDETFSIFAA